MANSLLQSVKISVTLCNVTESSDHKMKLKNLSALEQLIMNLLWERGPSTAEACREGLADRHPLKDSTIRTLLRRLEAKGYLRHEVDGRTFLYRPLERPQKVAAHAGKQIMHRLCGGSLERLPL